MEIVPGARKHGLPNDDIRHAFENAITAITLADQPDFTMLVGPDHAGRLIEVGVLADDDNDYVIHAMPARPKFLKTIRESKGDR